MTWRELLSWDPGAVSVKATCAVLCTVLFFIMSSTEDKERFCCSRKSSSTREVKAGLVARQSKSYCQHFVSKSPLTVNMHNTQKLNS